MKITTKYFLIFILCVGIIIVGYRYKQYVIDKDFILDVNVECNPSVEKCFVVDCDSSDPACDSAPYKKVEIKYVYALLCLEEHDCQDFSCMGIENNYCVIKYCSDSTLSGGEKCFK